MIERLLNFFLKRRDIHACSGNIYLRRWYILRTKRLAVFIHKFEESDEDRALHDHPWPFLVIPIWRGYYEHNLEGKHRVWPLLSSSHRGYKYRHRVELIEEKPAWSIFFRGKRVAEWGFWVTDTDWVHWKRWWSDNDCGEE